MTASKRRATSSTQVCSSSFMARIIRGGYPLAGATRPGLVRAGTSSLAVRQRDGPVVDQLPFDGQRGVLGVTHPPRARAGDHGTRIGRVEATRELRLHQVDVVLRQQLARPWHGRAARCLGIPALALAVRAQVADRVGGLLREGRWLVPGRIEVQEIGPVLAEDELTPDRAGAGPAACR